MKKRVLSMFMALVLCLTLLPAPVRAAEDMPESGAIVQQEQQEEISPAVSEQAGTNEEKNGSEGDPQNTGTLDAGGAEDSKADAPESGEDENAGNNADAAVSAVQTMIDALPIVSELDGMTADELDAAYDDIQAAYDAYEALNAEQQAQITGADFEALLGWFNSQTALLADAQSGEHIHCVCGPEAANVNGMIAFFFAAGPALAPVVGGQIVMLFGWHAVFLFLLVYSLSIAAFIYYRIPETLHATDRSPFNLSAVCGNYAKGLTHGAFMTGVIAHGILFMGGILYSAGSADFVIKVMGLDVDEFGWLSIPLIFASFAGSQPHFSKCGYIGIISCLYRN